ncbi:MAG: alkane 1-monooxygenase, partial [Pseudomonadota bacterium]
MTAQPDTRPSNPWPFWVSIGVLAVAVFAASRGGWWLALIPLSTWGLFSVLDILIGNTSQNADPETEDQALFW